MKKIEKYIESMIDNLPFVENESKKRKKVICMTAAISALVVSVIPYEIKIQKGKGVDIKCLGPRVTYEKGIGGNGNKYHKVQIRWFSFDD